MEKYTPTQDDRTWAKRVTDLLRDGGCIAMPYSGQIWKIDKAKKTVTLVAGDKEQDMDKHRATFATAGYSVFTETPIEVPPATVPDKLPEDLTGTVDDDGHVDRSGHVQERKGNDELNH